jgi:hypothetical protein
MTFIEGFAQGFQGAYEKRKDREAQKEDMMFKYKMDDLMKNKDLRTKKKQQESEWAQGAADLAGQLQDPESAAMFNRELRNGVSYETLQKRIMENQYEKNNDYVQPTQTVKLPSGVVTAPNTTDEKVAAPSRTPIGTMVNEGKLKREKAMEGSVNSQIDAIDPTLRTYETVEDETPSMDYADAPYKLKKNEYKLGSYEDSLFKLNKAKQDEDPEAIRQAQDEVRVHQMVLSDKAARTAKAEGKNVGQYFMLKPDGTIDTVVTGEVRPNQQGNNEVWNISDPRNEMPIEGPLVRIQDDKMMSRYVKITEDYSKKSTEHKTGAGSYISALDSAQKIQQILVNNPSVAARGVASGANLLTQLKGEVGAIYETLLKTESSIQNKIKSGDMEGVEKEAMAYIKMANDLAKEEGSGLDRLSLDKAKYDSLRVAASYQFAMAAGITNGKLSNQDFENNYNAIGGDRAANEVIEALNLTAQSTFIKVDSNRVSLENDENIKTFESNYGVKTGLVPERLGQMIMKLGVSDEQKAGMMQYLKQIQDYQIQNRAVAADTAGANQAPVQIKNVEEYNNLPKGATYIDPNGKKKVKK